MSDFENKNPMTNEAESVDDILAGILNPDGSFNDEFNGLLRKYVGGDANGTVLPVIDISDRRDEVPVPSVRVEYEAQEEEPAYTPPSKDVNERIEEKMPEETRAVFVEASSDAQRPGFTSTGDVRYPTMGVGAAEERVIYDADWEETAKREAARLERVRRERMLRGDSPYARSFSNPGAYMPGRSYYADPPQQSGSEYIDPLSRDADFEDSREGSQYYSSSKKTFFPEGFSVTQKNNTASGGKTERNRSGNMAYMRGGAPVRSDSDWLKVEEKPEKKKMGLFSKKKKAETSAVKSEIKEDYEELLPQVQQESPAPAQTEQTPRVNTVSVNAEEMSDVEKETEGLRSTVAEIVNKYNKRSEEDERRRLEKQARLEEERREKELRERRRLEEIRVIKQQMDPETVEAVESADAEDGFDEYEDFSTDTAPETNKPAVENETSTGKAFGVVFDPSVFDDENEIVTQLMEKISDTEADKQENGEDVESDTNGTKPIGKKKKGKGSRRKDS